MNRAAIRANVRVNLDDSGITYYSESEINDSIQDGYNEVAAKSRCIIKTAVDLAWVGNQTYYDFVDLGITDYLGTIAIFNNVTNLWLDDSLTLRDFDKIQRNWEIWVGSPQFWAPHSVQYIAIAPKYAISNGTFNLLYWGAAPVLASDTDVPLLASDMQILLELYATADLLETAEEPTKAAIFWNQYLAKIGIYKTRVSRAAKPDLLLRV